ncbi:MAG: nitroreductase family protein, partial [Lacticaseibacillus paracasei]|nr:nitroreductase family protein [Lacticaseibacillus paracasei]
NPWSGYDFKTIIPTLGLDPKRFVPVMAVAIGKAAEKPIHTDRYDVKQLIDYLD